MSHFHTSNKLSSCGYWPKQCIRVTRHTKCLLLGPKSTRYWKPNFTHRAWLDFKSPTFCRLTARCALNRPSHTLKALLLRIDAKMASMEAFITSITRRFHAWRVIKSIEFILMKVFPYYFLKASSTKATTLLAQYVSENMIYYKVLCRQKNIQPLWWLHGIDNCNHVGE